MLYFSETGWTLPGMKEVNAAFEQEYDEAAYERRIAALARAIEQRESGDGLSEEEWANAVERLSRGDHYLSVLIGAGGQRAMAPLWVRVAAVVVLVLVYALFRKLTRN